MHTVMSRALSLALTAASAVFVIGATQGAADAAAPVATRFAYAASGYGTNVVGGQVPAGSDTTAYMVIGCTNLAGLARENHEAASPMGGFGQLGAVTTKVGTSKVGTTFSSFSKSTVASLTMGDASLGTISIEGISSTSRAFHDPTGFHSTTTTKVAEITFTGPVGGPQTLEIPTPGQPIEIPGLAKISIGTSTKTAGAIGARAVANALVVEFFPSQTKIIVAHTQARINGGITEGIMRGGAHASKATALDDNLTSGMTPYQPLPCMGTHGKVLTKKTAKVDLGGQVIIDGLTASVMGDQKPGVAWGFARSSVAEINLGGGQLVVTGIVGKVAATRKDGVVKSNFAGTTIGTIMVGGEEMAFPDTDVIEIPGVLKLERSIVTKTKIGIQVIALRITLLDGTGAVIDLGTAKLAIARSGM